VLSSEITLFPRGIYVKCQAFARQRTGRPDRCHMTLAKNHVLEFRAISSCEEIILCSVGKEYIYTFVTLPPYWIQNEASRASFPRWRTTIAVCHTATTTGARKAIKI